MKRINLIVPALAVSLFIPLAATAASRASASPKPHAPAAATGTAKSATMVDVNTASLADLEAVPAIGKHYAQKIVDGRPYKTKDDLRTKKILPKSVYEKIQDEITAKP